MAEPIISGTPRWMRWTLLVSLALNLLVVGTVAGVMITGGPDRRTDRDRSDFGSVYTRALDEEDRRALRRDFMSRLDQQGRDRGAFIAEMRTTVDTLRATPFDADAFMTAMSDQSERRARREDTGRQVLAARIAAMTDAERAAYADRIEARLTKLAERLSR